MAIIDSRFISIGFRWGAVAAFLAAFAATTASDAGFRGGIRNEEVEYGGGKKSHESHPEKPRSPRWVIDGLPRQGGDLLRLFEEAVVRTTERSEAQDLPESTSDPLQTESPAFLALLDEHPHAAWAGLHTFAWRLLQSHPPPALRRLGLHEREDLIAELVEHLHAEGFARLKNYKPIGRPFSHWLLVVADRHARSRIRTSIRRTEATKRFHAPVAHACEPGFARATEARQVWEMVQEQLSNLKPEEKELLMLSATGVRPRHMARATNLPVGSNKEVSDRLRYLRRKLRQLVRDAGIWKCVVDILGDA